MSDRRETGSSVTEIIEEPEKLTFELILRMIFEWNCLSLKGKV